ncbi:hypothetical protein N7E81_14705 [Reichenbachiella carrageenanivorans]|uniref:Uncharacterized protein n=1 Tax=Reichenbachiella carrageenanivorans TaxID=2979869 RepID=A0ABY6CY08_9BACT|nr:hypothetical protein [Reichenbachiella carrageenanivorans]UXX78609.1 hypothetical protein N7E81_14705 [Reichenbachiella carrageenanivorans]
MKSNDRNKEYKKMIHDVAEAVSSNVKSANEYMEEEGIDFDSLISSGMKSIQRIQKTKTNSIELNKQQLYFRRVVLAGEIARKLYAEFTFGHVKFQKLMFLCEKICEYNLQDRYLKQAAGPMDHKFMHSIDKEFKKQNWFDVTREGKYKKFTYHPLSGLSKQEEYYSRYYSMYDDKIQWLLQIFKSTKTDKVELVATLFACWEEALQNNELVSDRLLIAKVYKWSKEKIKFKEAEIIKSIRWMEENDLFPH